MDEPELEYYSDDAGGDDDWGELEDIDDVYETIEIETKQKDKPSDINATMTEHIIAKSQGYKILSQNEVTFKILKTTQQLASHLDVSNWDATLLLRHFEWNKQKIIEKYFEIEDNTILLKQVGCATPDIKKLGQIIVKQSKDNKFMECPICLDDVKIQQMFHLDCGHQVEYYSKFIFLCARIDLFFLFFLVLCARIYCFDSTKCRYKKFVLSIQQFFKYQSNKIICIHIYMYIYLYNRFVIIVGKIILLQVFEMEKNV